VEAAVRGVRGGSAFSAPEGHIMPPTTLAPEQPPFAALRLVKVPDGAPPYDGETHRAGPGGAAARAEAGSCHDAPQRAGCSAPAASPAVAGTTAALPRQLAQVMVEILAGMRPMRQVVPMTTDRARERIRHLAPALSSDRQPRIRSFRTSRPAGHVLEIAVVASFGSRTRAVAMRFEHVAGREAAPGLPARPARWLCTEIESG
jgi:Family of unknown function (DUF6459)